MLAIICAMLLAGGALLYLNSDYLNAAVPSERGEVGAVASAPAAETTSCTAGCGDCTSSDPCTGEAECLNRATFSGSGDCDGHGTCSGDGQCANVHCSTAESIGNSASESPSSSFTYERGASWTTPEGYSYKDDYKKSCTSGCPAR